MGYVHDVGEGVTARQLFKAMLFKIDGADRFQPVTSVSVRAAVGAAADEGAVWRSMKYAGPGPMKVGRDQGRGVRPPWGPLRRQVTTSRVVVATGRSALAHIRQTGVLL